MGSAAEPPPALETMAVVETPAMERAEVLPAWALPTRAGSMVPLW